MSNPKPKTALFVTCLVDLFRPSVAFASLALLERAKHPAAVPREQTCCGQPAFNNGDLDAARRLACQVISRFEEFDWLVIPSASCGGMLKRHYPGLFADDAAWRARAEALADKVVELSQFLTEVSNPMIDAEYKHRVCYHDTCSALREMGIRAQPRELLSQVSGLSLVDLEEPGDCCGFGGTFAVKHPEISLRMAGDKADDIVRSGADTLVGGDLGCLLNIAGRLSRLDRPIRVYHLAEVLAGMTGIPAIGEQK